MSRLLPPTPAFPGSGCRQLHPTATTARRQRSSTSIRTISASWRTTDNWTPSRSTVLPPRCLAFDLAGRLFVRRRRTGAAPGSSWSGESFPPCLLVVADEVGGRAPVLPVPTDATVLGSGAESSPRPRRSNEEEGAHFRGFSRRYRPIAVEQEWNTGGYFGGIWGREGPARASREIKKSLCCKEFRWSG